MDIGKQLNVLQAAQGEPAKLALAAIDLAFSEMTNTELQELRESLEAAAIPHWCDETILATLLGISNPESTARLSHLRKLNILELFPARGENAVNVHEATRLALRKRMADKQGTKFRMVSARAAAYFSNRPNPSSRIERIYHLLCADPDLGADELQKLDRQSKGSGRPEDDHALAVALTELEETSLVKGRARVWVLLSILSTGESRGEAAQSVEATMRTLDLARKVSDQRAEAEACGLLGAALMAQSKLVEAQSAYADFLKLSRRLVKQEPDNADWLQDLAVAQSRMGDVFLAQKNSNGARTRFEKALKINLKLAKRDPLNAGWQKDLAVAHSKMGDVFLAQDNLDAAQAAFGERLKIFNRLAENDPRNTAWQRGLAITHSKLGDVLRKQSFPEAALAAFEKYRDISHGLVERDPGNVSWQCELAFAHIRVGDMLLANDDLEAAQAAFEKRLEISRCLAKQTPTVAARQRELMVAHNRMGLVLKAQGKLAAAKAAIEKARKISHGLVEQDPVNPD